MFYRNKYKFLLDGSEVFPSFGQGASLEQTKESGFVFLRERFNGTLRFINDDYEIIKYESKGHKFALTIQKKSAGVFTDYRFLFFYKTDCSFDIERKTVIVQPTLIDGYEKIVDGLNKEFSVLDLDIPTVQLNHVKQPLFQIYLPGSDLITNYLGGLVWEQATTVEESNSTNLVNNYKFTAGERRYYIPGEGVIDEDVSGYYDYTTLQRSDGIYELHLKAVPGGNIWVIRTVSGSIEKYNGSLNLSITDAIFNSLTTSDVCQAIELFPHCRVLTDELSINGTTTFDVPSSDIVANSSYNRVLGLSLISNQVIGFDGHSTTPTKYGKFGSSAVNFTFQYFTKPTGQTYLPVSISKWVKASIWFYFTSAFQTIQETASTDKLLNNAYKLEDFISSLLTKVDNSISFSNTSTHSNFFYDTLNPITSFTNEPVLITPKRSVIDGDISFIEQPPKVKLSDVFEMLENVYNVLWYVDNGLLKLEHRKFFEQGKSYSSNVFALDFTNYQQTKTGKNAEYGLKKYVNQKEELPEEIVFNFMDKGSKVFDGYSIIIVDDYVEKGNIQEKNISRFTSDIDYVQASTQVSKDGFVIVTATATGSSFTVPFVTISFDGEIYKVQNGDLAMTYLQPAFHRHGLPALDVEINNESTAALSIKRIKEQDLTITGTVAASIDTMELVRSSLGVGDIQQFALNLTTEFVRFKGVFDGIGNPLDDLNENGLEDSEEDNIGDDD